MLLKDAFKVASISESDELITHLAVTTQVPTSSRDLAPVENPSQTGSFKKDDIIWVEVNDKIYLAKVVNRIKNVQVAINRHTLTHDFTEIVQVDPSKCYPIDSNRNEILNLMWSNPGKQSLAQVVRDWTSYVNQSFEDVLRSPMAFSVSSFQHIA